MFTFRWLIGYEKRTLLCTLLGNLLHNGLRTILRILNATISRSSGAIGLISRLDRLD